MLVERARMLVERACSTGCLREECEKLAVITETLEEALSETRGWGMELGLLSIAGYLREAARVAWARGCRDESKALMEAAALLEAVAR